METRWILVLLLMALAGPAIAQRECATYTYQQQQIKLNNSLPQSMEAIENFTRHYLGGNNMEQARIGSESVIKIPVVVHNLYHFPDEIVSDAQVHSQIKALNDNFRRRNADTINTPVHFKPFAADTEIEFILATSDPGKRNTKGIIRKYSPILEWQADDKMKFSSQMGSDAWDPKSYLNIWVCNLDRVMGYSSVLGGALETDGVVIGQSVFGTIGTMGGFDMGRTTVHEVGHWLGLRHLWGNDYCGDDLVEDTPKQAGYNVECPSGIRKSCGTGPFGDMYMNFMDFTNDNCMNLFTLGQKSRMRSLFAPGGPRYSLLLSAGLNPPLIFESEGPLESPKWLKARMYPNPATSELMLDLAYDIRWIGKPLFITNLQGQVVMNVTITSKNQRIDIRKMNAGIYFISAKKDDGETMKLKFIKL